MVNSGQRQHPIDRWQLTIICVTVSRICWTDSLAMLLEIRLNSAKCHHKQANQDWLLIQLRIASMEPELATQPEQHQPILVWIQIVLALPQSYRTTQGTSHAVYRPSKDSQISQVVWLTATTTWWEPKLIKQTLSHVILEISLLHPDQSLEKAFTMSKSTLKISTQIFEGRWIDNRECRQHNPTS